MVLQFWFVYVLPSLWDNIHVVDDVDQDEETRHGTTFPWLWMFPIVSMDAMNALNPGEDGAGTVGLGKIGRLAMIQLVNMPRVILNQIWIKWFAKNGGKM